MSGRFFVAGSMLAIAMTFGAAAWASDPPAPAASEPATEADTQSPAPLTPPPGISIMPSSPPSYERQVPGCSVRQLKPLELIV